MTRNTEEPIRQQLLEARKRIEVQIKTLDQPTGHGGRFPDNAGIIAELEKQLEEINSLLVTFRH